tara:strand:- start:193 stop:387 length:195 start_codon:yes stop_codon:yes gene_type:complete
MSKKLNSLSDLAKIKFDGLVPDQEETIDYEPDFTPQHLEAHFSKKGEPERLLRLSKVLKETMKH